MLTREANVSEFNPALYTYIVQVKEFLLSSRFDRRR